MGWKDFLPPEGGEDRALPWIGGRKVTDGVRTWDIQGRCPNEHGWYTFKTDGGRKVTLVGPAEADFSFEESRPLVKGYLVGDRIIPDSARVDPNPEKLIEQTEPVFLVEPGLDRFSRATAMRVGNALVFSRLEFPDGPEAEVLAAYQDRKESVTDLAGVTPALDLAFRWISYQRVQAEERQREMERIRAEEEAKRLREEKRQQAMKDLGTGAGRRALAEVDFDAAARAALRISGAELLDTRRGYNRNNMVVQYRFQGRRLECEVDKRTLRVVDAGVCLDNHRGLKGDTFFTLESLPPVIAQAMREHRLVVWRHVAGDQDNPDHWRGDFDEWEDEDF